MTYELAKQLKDAGFELKLCDGDHHCFQETIIFGVSTYHFPTLSELIAAVCKDGTHYFSLDIGEHWINYEDEKDQWSACYYPDTPVGNILEYGNTPEEAVAKLWLALNSKMND